MNIPEYLNIELTDSLVVVVLYPSLIKSTSSVAEDHKQESLNCIYERVKEHPQLREYLCTVLVWKELRSITQITANLYPQILKINHMPQKTLSV